MSRLTYISIHIIPNSVTSYQIVGSLPHASPHTNWYFLMLHRCVVILLTLTVLNTNIEFSIVQINSYDTLLLLYVQSYFAVLNINLK